jgi:hypothetical protein
MDRIPQTHSVLADAIFRDCLEKEHMHTLNFCPGNIFHKNEHLAQSFFNPFTSLFLILMTLSIGTALAALRESPSLMSHSRLALAACANEAAIEAEAARETDGAHLSSAGAAASLPMTCKNGRGSAKKWRDTSTPANNTQRKQCAIK